MPIENTDLIKVRETHQCDERRMIRPLLVQIWRRLDETFNRKQPPLLRRISSLMS